MKKPQYKVGDYVIIINPTLGYTRPEKYNNWLIAKNRIAKIVYISETLEYPYQVSFIGEIERGIPHVYNRYEIRPATKDEIMIEEL